MIKKIEPKFVGVDGAEIRSGLSRWYWRRLCYAGRIASSKVGKRLLIPVSEVDRILAEGYRPALAEEKCAVRESIQARPVAVVN